MLLKQCAQLGRRGTPIGATGSRGSYDGGIAECFVGRRRLGVDSSFLCCWCRCRCWRWQKAAEAAEMASAGGDGVADFAAAAASSSRFFLRRSAASLAPLASSPPLIVQAAEAVTSESFRNSSRPRNGGVRRGPDQQTLYLHTTRGVVNLKLPLWCAAPPLPSPRLTDLVARLAVCRPQLTPRAVSRSPCRASPPQLAGT